MLLLKEANSCEAAGWWGPDPGGQSWDFVSQDATALLAVTVAACSLQKPRRSSLMCQSHSVSGTQEEMSKAHLHVAGLQRELLG